MSNNSEQPAFPWIRREDSLPPHKLAILLAWEGTDHVCEGRYDDGRLLRKPRPSWEAGMRKVSTPTHWQYLPKGPERPTLLAALEGKEIGR
jgi:hypothetical protein